MTSPFVPTSAIQPDGRQCLNGSFASAATSSVKSDLSLCDTHSEGQHLHRSAKEYLNSANVRFSYGSSCSSLTHCGGGTSGTGFSENPLSSTKSGCIPDPRCYAQFAQYNAVRNPDADCRKPEPGLYRSDGVARNAYRKYEGVPDAAKKQREEIHEGSNILDFALDRTLDEWNTRIKNIGSDVPLDKLAQMLLDTPDAPMMSKRNEPQMNSTFEPLGYSIIDKDERSYYARNQKNKDFTLEGIEPSEVSWRISPEDNISLFQSRVMNGTSNSPARHCSAGREEYDSECVLNGTADLMNRIKDFSSDVSGCDMADMLLPPPNGKPTKERLANYSSDFSDVPNMSDINSLIKAGLSSDELINKLLGNTSAWQKEAKPVSCPARKNANLNHTSDDSFIPMSYSIIDKDEESVLNKYQMANDVTLNGIENSNISWQLNPSEISLFSDHKSVCSNRSFLRSVENTRHKH